MRCVTIEWGGLVRLFGMVVSAGLVMGGAAEAATRTTGPYSHVLLISIDGLHALDVANYVAANPKSTLAELTRHGVTYTSANTPFSSDSFPGLLALVTGGSPLTHHVFYDVSYDRAAFDPGNAACSGPAGTTIRFDESVDQYRTDLPTGNQVSTNVLDPKALPHRVDRAHRCVPFYPHALLPVNTVFEVVHAERGRTAWSDKHPVYEVLNGPSGKGVDDLYTPEVTHVNGYDTRNSVVCTVANDALKVQAVLNQIQGRTHDGRVRMGVPALFGSNLQAVSVAQKLVKETPGALCDATEESKLSGQPGGYLDGAGTPSPLLQYGLDKTDAALGSMVEALRTAGLYGSTLIIVTAKHGQSPINPASALKIGRFAKAVANLPDAANSDAAQAIAAAAACNSGPCGHIEDDDVAMIWLKDQSQTDAVADYLGRNVKALHIAQILAGRSLTLRLDDPLSDSRTPDLVVVPDYGVLYTDSTSKNAEHGGLSYSDTNVGLVVSSSRLKALTVKVPVLTSQVAPTILEGLGIDPRKLDAVRREYTQVLPGLSESH